MPTWPVAFRTLSADGPSAISAASYTADELPAPGDVIQIADARATVEAIQPRDAGPSLIVAERIDD
jgi:hypothetical protein